VAIGAASAGWTVSRTSAPGAAGGWPRRARRGRTPAGATMRIQGELKGLGITSRRPRSRPSCATRAWGRRRGGESAPAGLSSCAPRRHSLLAGSELRSPLANGLNRRRRRAAPARPGAGRRRWWKRTTSAPRRASLGCLSPAATAERFCAAAHSSSGASAVAATAIAAIACLRRTPEQASAAYHSASAGARSKNACRSCAPPHQRTIGSLARLHNPASPRRQNRSTAASPNRVSLTPRARGPSISGGRRRAARGGKIFNIFTLRDGRIVRIDDYRRRGEGARSSRRRGGRWLEE